ncbi:MAG: hypothetical protein ACRDQH_05565 [Pseudonocardiaceae bacterium]
MPISLNDVTERLFKAFDGQIPLPEVRAIVRDCQTHAESEPEASIERRIHQRLRSIASRRAMASQSGV